MRIVRQNIVFALGVKVLILVLGAFGIANMWLAVFADVGVAVIAILERHARHEHALHSIGRKQRKRKARVNAGFSFAIRNRRKTSPREAGHRRE